MPCAWERLGVVIGAANQFQADNCHTAFVELFFFCFGGGRGGITSSPTLNTTHDFPNKPKPPQTQTSRIQHKLGPTPRSAPAARPVSVAPPSISESPALFHSLFVRGLGGLNMPEAEKTTLSTDPTRKHEALPPPNSTVLPGLPQLDDIRGVHLGGGGVLQSFDSSSGPEWLRICGD